MPWQTPTLREVRQLNRDYIASRVKLLIPNSVARVVADAAGGNAHLALEYLDWLAAQLLPDTAETEWLDRQANIWLVNSDGSKGRKAPTAATGSVTVTGTAGTVVPVGSIFSIGSFTATGSLISVTYQSTVAITVGVGVTEVPLTCLLGGVVGNRLPGDTLQLARPISGLFGSLGIVVSMSGGVDEESDDELRARVLQRIQQPPMGGDASDYVQWATAFPGVTRAWCSPTEMGPGTATLRFMMDDLRAATGGFPTLVDIANVQGWLNTLRPVTVLDLFVEAPIPQPVSLTLSNLTNDDSGTLTNITASLQSMFRERAAPAFAKDGIFQPAQTIYAAWASEAVLNSSGVVSFDLDMADAVPVNNGSMCVLGNIIIS